jgi:hypothetical protein
MSSSNEPRWEHCNTCGGNKKHAVVGERVHEGSEDHEHFSIWWKTTNELLECLGCEHVTLKRTEYFSEYDEPSVAFFPPPIYRPIPAWHGKVPWGLGRLLSEIYSAIQANSKSLSIMGARAVVEHVVNEKVGDKGTFDKNLDGLVGAGFLSQRNKESLSAAIDAGSAAIHRGFQPSDDDVNHVMDIVENMVQSVYISEQAGTSLKQRVPPRPPRS